MRFDDINKFNNHFNVYTTNQLKDPQEVLKQHAVSMRDTIETSAEQIEKEVQQRFHANNYQLPNERIAMIARAGKIAFMTVTFPPYLLLYAIPRWLGTHILPVISKQLEKAVKHSVRPLEKMAEIMIQQLHKLQIVWKILQKKVQRTQQLFSDIFKMLSQPFKTLLQRAKGVRARAVGLVAKARGLLRKGAKAVKKQLARVKAKKESLTQRVKSRFLAYKNQLTSHYTRFKEFIQPPFQAIINPIKKAQEYIKATVAVGARHFKERVATLKRLANKQLERCTHVCQKAINTMRKRANQLRERVLSPLTALVTMLPTLWQTIALPAKNLYKNFSLKNIKAQIKTWRGLIKNGRIQLRQALSNNWQRLSSSWRKVRAKMSNLVSAKTLKEQLRRVRLMVSPSAWMQQWRSSRPQDKKPPVHKRTIAALRAYGDTLSFKVRRAIYWTRLISAWIRILSRFWMVSVRHLSTNSLDYLAWRALNFKANTAS